MKVGVAVIESERVSKREALFVAENAGVELHDFSFVALEVGGGVIVGDTEALCEVMLRVRVGGIVCDRVGVTMNHSDALVERLRIAVNVPRVLDRLTLGVVVGGGVIVRVLEPVTV